MKKLSTNQIRSMFLEYFEANGHKKVHSASLVPGNDPTLLFTNAGMVPFKDIFIGAETRDYKRATTAQRCVRAGGKHNDLENVGYTARHHTFFEMMGNFSFGDYFKAEAIPFAWNLLTKVFELPAEKLWATVYHEDDEAYEIWNKVVGLPAERIIRIGDKAGKAKYESDNFWAMGDTGPCGPCTEIFYDHGEEVFGGPPGSPDEDGDRFIEIWNIVFMQFERDSAGNMKPLPKPSIDTGMGLERMAAVMQGVHSNYEIDLFVNLLNAAAEAVGCKNEGQASLKVIADHIRSTVFLMVDGVLPSNEGRGYVLRRIMRRAIRHGYKLGQKKAFFYKLVAPLVAEMGEAYPEIKENADRISEVIFKEEQKFAQTLEGGMEVLEADLEKLNGKIISGETVFKLYDTFGFPVDLTADIARERGLSLDMDGYDKAMEKQREMAKNAGKFKANITYEIAGKTEFVGYDNHKIPTKIKAIFQEGKAVDFLDNGDEAVIVLEKTPFYAEMGGQVGDSGIIFNLNSSFAVADTQKQGDNFLHIGKLQNGRLKVGDEINAEIYSVRRSQIQRHHSATHLLHKALREVLGTSVQQKGSLVDEFKTRFDFSYDEPLSNEQIKEVENKINEQVLKNLPVKVMEMPFDEAKKLGAMALFGEKYGDIVRVVKMGEDDYSIEFCGGCHTRNTGDIGLVKIIEQSAVSAGVRRVECVAGQAFMNILRGIGEHMQQLTILLKTDATNVVERVMQLQQQIKNQDKEIANLKRQLAKGGANNDAQAQEIGGFKVLCVRRDGFDNATLRDTADQLRDSKKLDLVLVGSANEGGTCSLILSLSKDAVAKGLNAGKIIAELAKHIDGKGGGRPDFAQAGGKKADNLDKVFAALSEQLAVSS